LVLKSTYPAIFIFKIEKKGYLASNGLIRRTIRTGRRIESSTVKKRKRAVVRIEIHSAKQLYRLYRLYSTHRIYRQQRFGEESRKSSFSEGVGKRVKEGGREGSNNNITTIFKMQKWPFKPSPKKLSC
jgi:hypothetical protein